MPTSTIEEFIAAFALALATEDKDLVLELTTSNEVNWSSVPKNILKSLDDLFNSANRLFE